MGTGRSSSGMWSGRAGNADGLSDPYGGENESVVADGNPPTRTSPSDAALHWRDTALDQPVGPMPYAPNLGPDVAKVQRLMSGAGRYDAAGQEEQGGLYSDALEHAIRSYQRDKGLADDGTLMPNGPTAASLKRDLFGRARAGKGEDVRAGARDLRGARDAERSRVTSVSDPSSDAPLNRARSGYPNLLLDGDDDEIARQGRRFEQSPQPPRDAATRRKYPNILLDGDDQDERRSASRKEQLAQNDPASREPENPWGNAGDVRRKDNDELARMGYGTVIWLPDQSDPTGRRVILYDTTSMESDHRTMDLILGSIRPVITPNGDRIVRNKADLGSPIDPASQYQKYFTWEQWRKMDLSVGDLEAMKYSPSRIANPFPNGQFRFDFRGDGYFGAVRSRGKNAQPHAGVDIQGAPGSDIYSPIDGVVSKFGAYNGFPVIEIRGTGQHAGIWVRLLYATPLQNLKINSAVQSNEHVARLPDIGTYYNSDQSEDFRRTKLRMNNHLHLEMRIGQGDQWEKNRSIDPTPYIAYQDP